MRKLLATSFMAAAAAALTLTPASAAPHSDTYSYIAVGGDAVAFNCDGAIKVTDVGVGGLCFDILRGDTTVTVTMNDESGIPTGGTLRFRDPANTRIGTDRFFCGTTGTLTIPAGADEILVWTQSAKSVAANCGPSTKGTMTAAFS